MSDKNKKLGAFYMALVVVVSGGYLLYPDVLKEYNSWSDKEQNMALIVAILAILTGIVSVNISTIRRKAFLTSIGFAAACLCAGWIVGDSMYGINCFAIALFIYYPTFGLSYLFRRGWSASS